MLEMKSRKRHMAERIERPNQERIITFGENETKKNSWEYWQYSIKQVEMKEKIKKEYRRRTKKLLETKLFNRNLIKWAVPLVR